MLSTIRASLCGGQIGPPLPQEKPATAGFSASRRGRPLVRKWSGATDWATRPHVQAHGPALTGPSGGTEQVPETPPRTAGRSSRRDAAMDAYMRAHFPRHRRLAVIGLRERGVGYDRRAAMALAIPSSLVPSGVLGFANASLRAFIELLAGTGLRVSKALALQLRHLALVGACPRVRVRRALRRGRIEPPKSRHGRRDVPLSPGLVDRLRGHLADLPHVPEALDLTVVLPAPIRLRPVAGARRGDAEVLRVERDHRPRDRRAVAPRYAARDLRPRGRRGLLGVSVLLRQPHGFEGVGAGWETRHLTRPRWPRSR
jgi:hypothetical protein